MEQVNQQQKDNLVLGYCCINTHLRAQCVYCSRTCRLKTVQDKGLEHCYALAHANLKDMLKILQWNYDHNIFSYRMSSDMFPFASHPDYYTQYEWTQFESILAEIGNTAKRLLQRLTFHPGQYNQLGSHREEVVEKTILDLHVHAKIMDMIGIDQEGVMILHGGSKNGGKDVALDRFKRNFRRLSPNAQARLVVENCEMAYSIQDLLPLSTDLQVPIVVDFHHHNINPGTAKTDDQLIHNCTQAIDIWRHRGITPLFHISESRPGTSATASITQRRAHSDYIVTLPAPLLTLVHEQKIYVDVEAKMKEDAVLRLYKKYSLT